MNEPLKLGVAGLGTVGSGLLQLLAQQHQRLANILGRKIIVVGVNARAKNKDRGANLDRYQWFDDPVRLAASDTIDVFVELIGGEEGAAKDAVEAALQSGKHVVTANKALLATHGVALARLAETNGVALNFEAAVAGGIPVIKTLREALVPNDIERVFGILNGTCNFILTKMQDEGGSFADVLKEAQDIGYAEADPTFDIGGFDTAHKLSILSCLAFGTQIAFDQIHVEGIDAITQADIEAADNLGYRIKLLGVAMRTDGQIEARVHPAMVSKHTAIAEVSGATNCVAIDGNHLGNLLLVGPGAGGLPTATAVASDLVDIARGIIMPPLVKTVDQLQPCKRATLSAHKGAYYIRLSVEDRPGVLALLAKRLGDRDVSLESVVQRHEREGMSARSVKGDRAAPITTVIIITHETTEANIRAALEAIEGDGYVAEKPQMIRIEKL